MWWSTTAGLVLAARVGSTQYFSNTSVAGENAPTTISSNDRHSLSLKSLISDTVHSEDSSSSEVVTTSTPTAKTASVANILTNASTGRSAANQLYTTDPFPVSNQTRIGPGPFGTSGGSTSAKLSSITNTNHAIAGFINQGLAGTIASVSRNGASLNTTAMTTAVTSCQQLSDWDNAYTAPALTGCGKGYAVDCDLAKLIWSAESARWESNQYQTVHTAWVTTTTVVTQTSWKEVLETLSSGASLSASDSPLECDPFSRKTIYTAFTEDLYLSTNVYSDAPQYSTILVPGCSLQPWPFPLPSCVYTCPSDTSTAFNVSLTASVTASNQEVEPEFVTKGCRLVASSVQVFYWPVTTTGLPSCGVDSGLTWDTIAPASGLRTTVVAIPQGSGPDATETTVTMTSPSVYLAVAGLSAEQFVNVNEPTITFGTADPNQVLSLAPGELSSVVQHLSGYVGSWQDELDIIISSTPVAGSPYVMPNCPFSPDCWDFTERVEPFNLFNLQRPVPASAYFFTAGGWGMWPRDKVIRPDYHARVAVPPQLASLDPAWVGNCDIALGGMYDPPQALWDVPFASATPALGPIVHTQQASPGPSLPILPKPTAPPDPAASRHDPDSGQSPSSSQIHSPPPAPAPQQDPGEPQGPDQAPQDPASAGKGHPQDSQQQGSGTDQASNPLQHEDGQGPAQGSAQAPTSPGGQTHGQGQAAPLIAGSDGAAPTDDGSVQQVAGQAGGSEYRPIAAGGSQSGAIIQLGSDPDLIPMTAVVGQKENGQGLAVLHGVTMTQGGPAVLVNGANVHFDSDGSIVAVQDEAQSGQPATVKAAVSQLPQPAGSDSVQAFRGAVAAMAAAAGTEPVHKGQAQAFDASGQSKAAMAAQQVISATPTLIIGSDGKTTRQAIVAGQTLVVGQTPTTVSGHVFSLANDGNLIVDGKAKGQLPVSAQAFDITVGEPPALTAPPSTITAGPLRGVSAERSSVAGKDGKTTAVDVVDGTTVSAGSVSTIHGHAVSVASDGALIVDGISTMPATAFPNATGGASTSITMTDADGPHTVGVTKTSTVGADGKATAVDVVGSVTLTAGGAAATVDGHVFSVRSNGELIEDGTSTIAVGQTNTVAGVITNQPASSVVGSNTGTVDAASSVRYRGAAPACGRCVHLEMVLAAIFAHFVWALDLYLV